MKGVDMRKRLSGITLSLVLQIALAHLSLITAQGINEYPPEMLEHPAAGQTPTEKTSKRLTCSARAIPSPVYSWFHDGQPIDGYQNLTTGVLGLHNLSQSDNGEYRCLARNSLGAELSAAAVIKVAALRPFTQIGPQEVVVDQGKAIVLALPTIDRLALELSWEQNNVTLQEYDIFHRITINSSLVLLSVDMNLNGKEYRVKAEYFFTGFESWSSPYKLRVRDASNPTNMPPEVIVAPVDTYATLGDENVHLECIINARPMSMLTLNWYRVNQNGTRTLLEHENSKYLLTPYKRRLIIREIVASDSGRYQCEGILNVPGMSGSFTPATAAANLTVQVPPLLTTVTKTLERDFSQTATLECQADGVPKPTRQWFFNGRDIAAVLSNRHTLHANGTLVIRNLDLPDAGKYQCFARNVVGETYQAIWLKVNSAPPQIVKAPENLTIVELSDARFFCQVTGAPSPQITWKKVVNGIEQPVVIGGRFQVFPDSLLIATVEKADSGVYKCTATNIKGTQSAQAQLVVITKTQIIRPPQNQTVILSTLVRFECGISRDDNTVPVWEWFFYKNGDLSLQQQLTSTGRYQITNEGTLSISGVAAQDIGLYKCHVISAGGNDSRIATLKVIELPRPPTITSIVLNPNQNRSVIVTWTKAFDGNSPLLKYIITYRQENPNGNNDGVSWDVYPVDITPTAVSYAVSNLRPSRYYRFRISAVNTVGEGNASLPMPNPAIKMPAQPPSAPPRNFFCTQGLEKEILATWDPPEESTLNGDLKGYVIRYKVANLPDSTLQEEQIVGPDRRSYTIQFLVSFKQYAVSIAAYNEEGKGVFSNPFYVWTPQGRPTDAPKNVVAVATNSTIVRLQWDPPNPGEINGNNLGYMIEIKQNNSLVRSFFVGSDSDNLEAQQETLISDLRKFTSYSISLACRTSPGLGPYSTSVNVTTQEDVPGPVLSLSFENIRDRSLTVKWLRPTEVNGILIGYILEYERKNVANTRQPVNLPASLTYYTIQDLVPVTNYTIYVAATTAKGTGQWVSADIQSGVPPELPGPPHNLGISNIQDRTVLLQFFPGFDGKTSITLWIVLAKEAGQQNYQEIYTISDPTARDILVQNLKPYTKYQLKLIAENIVGRSAPSEPTREFETLQAPPSSPPGNVTVRALNSTALRISWTPIPSQEWNGAPRGYKINYRMWSSEKEDAGLASVQEPAWTTIPLENGINIDSYILPRLQEWMDYEARMIAYNDVGVSPYSRVVTARTRESTPSASPSNLKAKSMSSTQILVTWSPVPRLEQNGQILGYKVLYKPQTQQLESSLSKVVEGKDATNVTLTGLLKYVMYEMSILAYTRMGDGIFSTKVVTRTDEDVPGPPIIIYFPNVTYTYAVVVWNSPKEPNGIITGYKVAYRKNGDTNPEPEVVLGPNIREHAVDNLERETLYMFYVTAKTQLGWGQTASVAVLTMIDRDRPEHPTQPTIGSLQVSARNITIAWRPGRDNYSPIRNYTVEYRLRGGPWTTFPETVPPDSTSYTVTGLRPNSVYQFRVAATNDIGMSEFSQPSAEVPTLSDKPDGAPQNLKVVAVTRTSIRASWERPAEDTWNGLLLSYVVQYRQIQQQDFQEDEVQFGMEAVVLSNLVISQTYEVQVLAVNLKGRGPPSRPATIYVGEAAPTAPPKSVQAVNKSSSSIEVTWVEPDTDTQNGGLSGYKVLFYKNSSSAGAEEQRIAAETRLVLGNLETFTYYFISIQAYNLAGEGPRSVPITARTSEGVPSAPGSLQFTNITMHQLTVSFQLPPKPNGYILLYEMEYFPTERNPFDPLPPKRILRDNETRVVVTGLDKDVQYTFRVSANTSVGRGEAKEADITTGPQPGSPSAPSKPRVSQKDDASLKVDWDNGVQGDSPVYGYLIQNKKEDEGEFVTLQQEISNEQSVEVSLTNLNPNTGYEFRVIAMNNQGISEPSVSSDVFVTPSLAVAHIAKPFHTEWWFLVIIALTGVIVILVIISLLCLIVRRKKAGKEMKRSQTNTTVMSEPSEPEEGGFPTYEMRQSRRTNAPRNGSVKNIYARPPPRPSPASVAYSDDDDDAMSTAKPPIPDDTSSSATEKPSDLDDSTEPSDEESEAESEKVPASPPPPAFSSVYANSDNVRQSWRFQSPYNAYTYTDSEADSSHYAFSLNNGQVVVNNVAGARTPLAGFSSFV